MRQFATVLTFMAAFVGAIGGAQQPPAGPPPIDRSLAAYASTKDSVRLADGRSIHFVCMGKGSPTVILTAGLGDWAASWSSVQPTIARTTRVCAWDRPGFGLSDAAQQPTSSDTMTADLDAALSRGSILGPYVLVGHSLGAFESLLYADRHPDKVAGMVLIDPSVPDQMALMKRSAPALAEMNDAYVKGLVTLVQGCVKEGAYSAGAAPRKECELPYPPTYPPALLAALKAEAAKPNQAPAVASFYQNVGQSGEQVINKARDYGSMPLVVLTATQPQDMPPGASAEAAAQVTQFMDVFNHEHDRLAALSTRGINVRVPGSSHYIHQIKPQVAIDAVNQVVAEARAAKR